jgi:uncharacterized membrane protein YtjA (UPF0391 family)
MLRWAVIFLVIAIVAGIPGFAGLMVAAAGIAKLLFLSVPDSLPDHARLRFRK